jgi:hypothetical protein
VPISDWYDSLEYYFSTRWRDRMGSGAVPGSLRLALSKALEDVKVDLVYPLETDDDDTILFLMASDDSAIIVRFEPPDTTEVSFFGPVLGGVYTETIHVTGQATEIEGVFKHARLPGDGIWISDEQVGVPERASALSRVFGLADPGA